MSPHRKSSISEMRSRKKNPRTQAVYNSKCIDSDPEPLAADLHTTSLCAQRYKSVLNGCFRWTPFFFNPLIRSLVRWACVAKSTLPFAKCVNLVAANRPFEVEDLRPNTLLAQIRKSNKGPPHSGVPGTSHADIPLAKQKRPRPIHALLYEDLEDSERAENKASSLMSGNK